eukprot:3421389-Heterocapsa_arctica.AAC.1
MEEYELDVEDHTYEVKEKSVADELPGGEAADEDGVSRRGRANCQEGKSMEDLGNYNPGLRPGSELELMIRVPTADDDVQRDLHVV